MSIWQHYSDDEKLVMLQQTAAARKIIEQAVEKDWWKSVADFHTWLVAIAWGIHVG